MGRHNLSKLCSGSNYSIPAPVVKGVQVSTEHGQFCDRDLEALIDTGAERTLVPIEVCEALQAIPTDYAAIQGFDRSVQPSRCPKYYLRIKVPTLPLVFRPVYGVERASILLGRDFLSDFVFSLHSPTGSFSISCDSWLKRLFARLS
jgi:hypothetical protein